MIRWGLAQASRDDKEDLPGAPHRLSAASAPMIAGDWTDPLELVLLGIVLLVVGLILGWIARAVRTWRTRDSR